MIELLTTAVPMAARTPIMKLLCAENQGRRLAYEGYTVATGHKRFLSVIDRGGVDALMA
jgi:hypothetical protein